MINVAIIEDDNSIRDLLVDLIHTDERLHCEHTFEDAKTAMAGIPKLDVDVVVVDIGLPDQSGIDCIRKLKPQNEAVQYLVYTTFEDTDLLFEALKAGASGYITKTTEPDKLIESIIDVYNGGSPMSSQIARKVVNSFYQTTAEMQKLSDREKEILMLLDKGFRYKEIASKLFLSTETIRTHIRNIYKKLQVNSRTEAINKSFVK
jgi:DNA-binding NarL/FixJ family response regulator